MRVHKRLLGGWDPTSHYLREAQATLTRRFYHLVAVFLSVDNDLDMDQ